MPDGAVTIARHRTRIAPGLLCFSSFLVLWLPRVGVYRTPGTLMGLPLSKAVMYSSRSAYSGASADR